MTFSFKSFIGWARLFILATWKTNWFLKFGKTCFHILSRSVYVPDLLPASARPVSARMYVYLNERTNEPAYYRDSMTLSAFPSRCQLWDLCARVDLWNSWIESIGLSQDATHVLLTEWGTLRLHHHAPCVREGVQVLIGLLHGVFQMCFR